MDATEEALNLFSTRIRQLIFQYDELKKEHAMLEARMMACRQENETLQAQLVQAQKDYDRLKTAKMLEVTDTDVESAQKRLQKLIRDVNKCITLLSEQ
ncbi:hypothetical protein [Segatella oulorum]|uniref:hypothetical protein n=1 Tax=Segatella oulorum TaxID=28136 RepID=UPI0028E2A4D8|nr:hypothetical protein [Segatella oulorum]